MGAFYNFIAFVGGFALVGVTRQLGPKITHALCLTAAGIGMLCLPMLRDQTLMFLPMVGIGLAWASMLGTPYVILAGSLPKHRVGVYMGIFNMFIVIPMIIQIFTLPLMYDTWLQSNPAHVIRLAGGLLVCAAVAVLFVKTAKTEDQTTQEQSANLAAGKA
jgi:maltose/moltooligosaccharide transporter